MTPTLTQIQEIADIFGWERISCYHNTIEEKFIKGKKILEYPFEDLKDFSFYVHDNREIPIESTENDAKDILVKLFEDNTPNLITATIDTPLISTVLQYTKSLIECFHENNRKP